MKKNIFNLIIPVVLLVIFSSCSAIKVTTDHDNKVDFAKYKTFNFSREFDKLALNDLNRRRLKNAITQQMESKGYQISESPDLLVNAFVKGKSKYTAYANTNYMGGPWGYYRGFGNSSTYVDVNKSIEGTLFINLIDVPERKMIWEGVAEGLTNPRTETREQTINAVVTKIFANFPN